MNQELNFEQLQEATNAVQDIDTETTSPVEMSAIATAMESMIKCMGLSETKRSPFFYAAETYGRTPNVGVDLSKKMTLEGLGDAVKRLVVRIKEMILALLNKVEYILPFLDKVFEQKQELKQAAQNLTKFDVKPLQLEFGWGDDDSVLNRALFIFPYENENFFQEYLEVATKTRDFFHKYLEEFNHAIGTLNTLQSEREFFDPSRGGEALAKHVSKISKLLQDAGYKQIGHRGYESKETEVFAHTRNKNWSFEVSHSRGFSSASLMANHDLRSNSVDAILHDSKAAFTERRRKARELFIKAFNKDTLLRYANGHLSLIKTLSDLKLQYGKTVISVSQELAKTQRALNSLGHDADSAQVTPILDRINAYGFFVTEIRKVCKEVGQLFTEVSDAGNYVARVIDANLVKNN